MSIPDEIFNRNIVQTFEAFNKRVKCKDRVQRLKDCGFKLVYMANSDKSSGKAAGYIARLRAQAFNEKHGVPVHVVYVRSGGKNYDGERHYDFYAKPLEI